MKKLLFFLCGLLAVIFAIPVQRGVAETPDPTPVPDALVAEALAAKRAGYPAWVGEEGRYLPDQKLPVDHQINPPLAPNSLDDDWTGVVFEKYVNNNWEIFKFQGLHENNPQTQLTFYAGSDIYPRYNQDATQIVFVSDRDGNLEIYTMDANGGSIARLTTNSSADSQPQWSKTNNRIVFATDRDGNAEIYIMNANGSGQTRLTNNSVGDVYPTVSPDGSQIAWLQVSSYGATVWVMNTDGSGQHPISPWYPYAQHLVWSPDGQWLTWDGDHTGDGWNEVVRIKPDGTVLHQVSPSGLYLYEWWVSSWTPDSQRLFVTAQILTVYEGQIYLSQSSSALVYTNNGNVTPIGSDYGLKMNHDAIDLDSQTPISQVFSLPEYSPANGFTVNWVGSDIGMSGLWNMDVQTRIGPLGSWTDWFTDVQSGSYGFAGDPGTTIYFRSQAIDRAGNVESWPEGNGDTFTTLYSWFLRGQVYDNRGLSLPAPTVNVSPQAINNDLAGFEGNFIRYNTVPTSTVVIHEPGFTSALPIKLVSDQNLDYFWNLAPDDNQISNGDFETNGLSSWNITGLLSSTQTAEQFHLGESAAQLGQGGLTGMGLNISNTTQSSTAPRIIRTPDNVLHAVWCDKTDLPGDPSPNVIDIFYSSKAPESPWTSPVIVSSAHQNEAYAPNWVVDPSGMLHLIWIESVYPYAGAYGLGELKYAFKPLGGTWSAPVVLDQNTNYWYYFNSASIVMDSSGGLHVTWTTGNHGVYYLFKSQGGDWTSSVKLSDTSGFLAMAIDGNDQIYVTWMSTYLYFATKPYGGNWGAVQTNEDIQGGNLLAQPNPAGGIFIFFEGQDNGYSNDSYLIQLDAEGNVSPAYQVTSGTFSYLFDMVLDLNGILHFAWGQYSEVDGTTTYSILYRQRFPDGTWSPPVILTQSDYVNSIYKLDLWVDPDGKLQTVWNAWFNFSDMQYEIYYAEVTPSQPAKATMSQVVNLDPNTVHKPTLSFVYQQNSPLNWNASPAFEVMINQTVVYSNNISIEGWTHTWIDLSPWLSQTVTVTFQTNYNPEYGFVYVYLDDITLSSWLTPVPLAVDLPHIPPFNAPTQITITGENFLEGATVRLDDTPLENVQWIDEHTLQATIPANLPPGRYHLWVTNPGGQASVLANAVIAGHEIFLPILAR